MYVGMSTELLFIFCIQIEIEVVSLNLWNEVNWRTRG